MSGASGDSVDFGFRDVPKGDKARLVRGVFDSVAPRYDLMNDLMSLGVHRLWKAALVRALRPRPGMALLDVAGGTGDIAVAAAAGGARAVVVDINEDMAAAGRARALDRGCLDVGWAVADAEAL
ncbi:MAG: methyltransferase domain-containing protein, partial [Alphaproteobacteria bacterium]|nr:methyltransferase domain-containing protein [Alphaproteobacteria bacterium]